MKYSVMYSSKTGNTKKLADAIVEELGSRDCIYVGEPKEEGFQADLIFLGSWTDKGNFDESFTHFYDSGKDKSIALFGTAGFGGSSQYFDTIMERVKQKLPNTCRIIATYMCQGKMPIGIRKRYEGMLEKQPEDKKIQDFLNNFDQAQSHPDEQDILHAKTFAQNVWKQEVKHS